MQGWDDYPGSAGDVPYFRALPNGLWAVKRMPGIEWKLQETTRWGLRAEDLEHLWADYQSGMSGAELSRQWGLAKPTVYKWIRRLKDEREPSFQKRT